MEVLVTVGTLVGTAPAGGIVAMIGVWDGKSDGIVVLVTVGTVVDGRFVPPGMEEGSCVPGNG